ncbi:MAG: YgfZ/GcvT domain-containing protein [Acidimicrobiia bacterium]
MNASALDAALRDAVPVDIAGIVLPGAYGDVSKERAALAHEAAKCDRSAAGIVEVRGADARTFLHALVSQDLLHATPPAAVHTLLLQPTGKLEVDMRARIAAPDVVWLDVELGRTDALIAALTRFKIRVDVTITDASEALARFEVRGPKSRAVLAQALGAELPEDPSCAVVLDDLWIVPSRWPELPGYELIGPRAAIRTWWETIDIPAAGWWAREDARIANGVPRDGVDIDSDTIPQEAFLEADAISFTKGCFLGQELVCRIDSRGHVNRFLRRLDIARSIPPVGAAIFAGEREVGRITSVSTREPGAIALAMIRREVEPGDAVSVRWDAHEATAHVVGIDDTEMR